jgi:hypothetical protein
VTRATYEREVALVYLLSGGMKRREALHEHTHALLARADFARLARLLDDRRLLPLIGSRALDAAPDLAPAGFRDAVRRAVARARANALAVEGTTTDAVRRLEAAGIRVLPLKGPLLAADVHGDTGLRETSDADLLVGRENLETAAGILQATGYAAPGDAIRAGGLPDLHLTMTHPSRPTIELHWRIHWDESEFSRGMLERAVPGPDGLLRAQPDDLAASLLLYYARDGFHGVRIVNDIAAWWDRHGHAMHPGFLEKHARRHPRLAPPLSAAARSAEALTGVPCVSWLGSAMADGRRVALAARFADWTQADDRDQLAANMSLVAALLASRGSMRDVARRELEPPQGGRTAAALHTAKLSGRWAIALWRVRGGRGWAPAPPL